MKPEELERELLAERPEIDREFAARLDEWATRGFPRGGELDPRRSPRSRRALPLPGGLRRTWERLRATPPRRILAPGAAAVTVLVIGGGVVVSQIDSGEVDGGGASVIEAPEPREPAEEPAPAGGAEPDAGAAVPEVQGRRDRAGGNGALDAGPRQRKVAQTVSVALATSPEDFRDAADGVLDVVRDHNGFVRRSSVSGGDPGVDGARPGRASFGLRIPANRLQAALGALSDLGHLVSRTDGTRDITARFRSAQDRIEAFTDSRDRLLRRLEDAVTETEQESIRRRLRVVESQLERAREDLARAQQRVRLVPVTVTIDADEAVADDAGWGLGDAVDDAGDILRASLGVGLVGAAALLPIALLVLLALLAARLVRGQQRERALDRQGG